MLGRFLEDQDERMNGEIAQSATETRTEPDFRPEADAAYLDHCPRISSHKTGKARPVLAEKGSEYSPYSPRVGMSFERSQRSEDRQKQIV